MKNALRWTTWLSAMLLAASIARAADDANTLDPAYKHASPEAVERWRDLKYGLRIHWGVYSMLGVEASWPLRDMPNSKKQEYQELYKKFNPTDFDAEKWMRWFKRCGLTNFAFTTKHHDGFSMFDTKTRVKKRVNWTAPGGPIIEDCDLAYSIMETPFRRDIVRELCDAAHRHGIAVDLYFSHIDWYDADFRFDAWNPFRDKTYNNRTDPAAYARFVQRHRGQIREILSNYGNVEMSCLDMSLPDFCWPDVKETVLMVRRLLPDVMLRNRGIGAYGDYHTPECWVPDSPVSRESNSPWMVIYPLGGPFAYQPDGSKYKPAAWILSNLIDIAAKGGNFQVGIGPDAKGNFHPEAVKRLEYVGDWLKINGEAIYGTRPREGDLWKEGEDIRFTRTKDKKYVYAIARKWPGERLTLKTLRAKEGSTIRMLGVDEPLAWKNNAAGELEIEIPAKLQDPANRPCPQAWAFRIEPAQDHQAKPGRQVKVAAIPIGMGGDRAKKTKQAIEQLETAGRHGVDIACLPEEFAGTNAEPIPGPTTNAIGELAKRHKMYVVCPIREQADKGRVYNTAVLLDREGNVAGRYRKVFAFWGEGVNLGKEGVPVFDTDFGRIAMLTCFDANFDEVWQEAERKGAEIVFWPSAYGGGMPLNGYAMIHNYYVVAVGEGNMIDITGRTLEKVEKPRPQQFIATLDLDRTLIHTNFNEEKVAKLLREHPGEVEQEWMFPMESWYLLRSTKPGVKVRDLCKQYQIETLREYRHRSRTEINERRKTDKRV